MVSSLKFETNSAAHQDRKLFLFVKKVMEWGVFQVGLLVTVIFDIILLQGEDSKTIFIGTSQQI